MSGIFSCPKNWTNSGQINWTNSGHEKILDKFWTNKTGQIPDIKNSGQIPDK